MVSTQDSESCDPSSNLGGTYVFFTFSFYTEAVIAQLGVL